MVLKEGTPHQQHQHHLTLFVRNAESGIHPDLLSQKLEAWDPTICVFTSLPGDTHSILGTGVEPLQNNEPTCTQVTISPRDDQSQRCQFTTHTCGQCAP